MPPSDSNPGLRWALAVLALLVAVVILAFTLFNLVTTSAAEGIALGPFREVLKESVQLRIGISNNLFNLAVLFTGALWGLVIAKRGEAGIEDRQEFIMFTCASLLLLTSLFSSVVYAYRVAYLYQVANQTAANDAVKIGDFFNPVVNNFFIYQIINLASGMIVAVITLISAHKLK